jgi:hypothetical protein
MVPAPTGFIAFKRAVMVPPQPELFSGIEPIAKPVLGCKFVSSTN